MRKPTSVILIALVSILGTTACTPGQLLRHAAAHLAGHGAEADAAARTYLQRKATATQGRPCPELYDYAMEAGFTPEQWEWPLSQTLWGESNCSPTANNAVSTADGAAQILRGTWAGFCADIPYDWRYQAGPNLECAYRVYRGQGWGAWEAAPPGAG